VLINTVAL